MITANPIQVAADLAAVPATEKAAAPSGPALIASPSPGCPRCAFPIRRLYAGELICPSCGRRETVAAEFWARIEAACIRGVRL